VFVGSLVHYAHCAFSTSTSHIFRTIVTDIKLLLQTKHHTINFSKSRSKFRKLYARYHPCLATRRLKKFHEDIPTSPEVIGVHTLNFEPNFKFSQLQFFGGTPVPLRVCAIKAWSISSACKHLRAQHPLRAEILCAE